MPRHRQAVTLGDSEQNLKASITQKFLAGASKEATAKALGLKYDSFRQLLERLQLNDPPAQWVTRMEASRALGLQQQGTLDMCKRHGVQLRHWSKAVVILRAADLDRLLAYQADQRVPLVDTAPAGYFTAQQIADRHGTSGDSLRTRLARDKVKPDLRLRVPRTAATPALYTLHQLTPYLPTPSKPAQLPAGWLTVKQAGAAAGVKEWTVRDWVAAGAPHLRVSHGKNQGAFIFQPEQLAKWLATSGVPSGAYRAHLLKQSALAQPLKRLVAV
jgi:hypothetical protein